MKLGNSEANRYMTKDTLTTLELKQSLIALKEHAPNTCIRLRMLGEMWQEFFQRIISISEERVLLHDEVKNKLQSFPILQVMQFDIDHRFRELQPHNHYSVEPDVSEIKTGAAT